MSNQSATARGRFQMAREKEKQMHPAAAAYDAEARWWCAIDDPATPEAAELLDQALHAEAEAEA